MTFLYSRQGPVLVRIFGAVTLMATLFSCGTAKPELIWSDEFDQLALSPAKWVVYQGDGCPELCGFGNNEEQYYTANSDNLEVKDGKLIITARKDSMGTSAYTSAKLVTKDLSSWKYGRIEVSAKLPSGRGTWPAIWMLPDAKTYGGWPRSGEIDIMEHVGYNQGMVYGTVHTQSFNHKKGTQKGDSIRVNSAADQFHEYAIEWTENKIDWFIDGEQYHSFENTGQSSDDWPFDQPFYLILNVAVGGGWGGKMGIDDTIWPQSMEVDYVRVYAFE